MSEQAWLSLSLLAEDEATVSCPSSYLTIPKDILPVKDDLWYDCHCMRVEDRPEHQTHPAPTPEDEQEMSFTTALRHLVDNMFTDQIIAERLQTIPGDGKALEVLVENWKQGLTQYLQETAQSGIHNIVATLDVIQASDTPLSVSEPHQWQEIEAWHKPFPVAYICREDLRGILPNEQIAALSDQDMAQIADKMSDAYQDGGGYWDSLMEIAGRISAEKQTPQPPTVKVSPAA